MLKSTVLAIILTATPAFAGGCEAYKQQIQTGADLVAGFTDAIAKMALIQSGSGLTKNGQKALAEAIGQINSNLRGYNARTAETLAGDGATCKR